MCIKSLLNVGYIN